VKGGRVRVSLWDYDFVIHGVGQLKSHRGHRGRGVGFDWCAVGVLRFVRARMSEDTAQGQESEGGTRAGSYFVFRRRFTLIYADLSLCGILFEGAPADRRVPIGSVGILRFVRARMSENTAQG